MTTTRPDAAPVETRERVPGQPDMWVFVLVESLIFTSYFGVYLFTRTQHEHAFLQAQSHLNLGLGVVETIALLTSSWSVARSVQTARGGDLRSATRDAFLAAGFGVLFLIFKIIEWVSQVHQGNTFTSNDFFQYFFFLTAIHALHLLIGFVVLGVLIYQLSRKDRCNQETVETCATYWHTVDFLWVLIFALLYVVR
jgi:nitric oxide reductase NorE protein